MERIKDYLLIEEEFVQNQERLKPQEEKSQQEREKVDELRGSPMNVGNLEEMIDDDHAIVSIGGGLEYYVCIMSFVDKDLLEPGEFLLVLTTAVAACLSACLVCFLLLLLLLEFPRLLICTLLPLHSGRLPRVGAQQDNGHCGCAC